MSSELICDDCGKVMMKWIESGDKKYCTNCFDSNHAKVCARCRTLVKTSLVNHEGQAYHSECFTCFHCRRPLAGKTFSKQEGNNVCQDCFRRRYAKTCAKCKALIEGSTKFASYDDKFYHPDCFNCAKCHCQLMGKKFFVDGKDKICTDCGN